MIVYYLYGFLRVFSVFLHNLNCKGGDSQCWYRLLQKSCIVGANIRPQIAGPMLMGDAAATEAINP